MIVRGAPVSFVRKLFIVVGQLGVGLCLFVCASLPAIAVPALVVSSVFFGFGSAPVFSIAQTLAGPRAAGQWMGVQNFVGNLAGMIAPFATGIMIDRTGHYAWAFVVAGVVTFAGAAAWGWLIPTVEPIAWRERAPPGAGPAAG